MKLTVLALLTLACSGSGKDRLDDSGSDGAFTPDPEDLPSDEVTAQAVFDVYGGAYDLAIHPDGRIFCSVEENGIYAWTPGEAEAEQITDSVGPIMGIAFSGQDLYFTTSLHRQEGSLSRLDGNTAEVIATRAGDTVFREPTDLVQLDDGSWLITDTVLSMLHQVNTDGSVTMIDPGLAEPTTLTTDGAQLFVGGTNGVVRIDLQSWESTPLDDRPVNGLLVHGDELWGTNASYGVFVVGEDRRIGFDELRLPGRLTGMDTVYVADWGNSSVWAGTP